MRSILLVEDKRGMRVMLKTALSEESWDVTAVADGASALKALNEQRFSAILTDVCLPGKYNGLDILQEAPNGVPVLVMTAFGTIDMAVAAMKNGAADFISKPFELDELLERLGQLCIENKDCMLGTSGSFTEAVARAERAAFSGMNVLILGESGTGKELLARRIHGVSTRADGPFIPVNCAAIPENLMESELFGAEKGAYTGSSEARPGRFTMASGGVIFLDEIGDLDLNLQGKLLRVLESGTYHSVGGREELSSDALVLSASNRDLKKMTDSGKFREDLYYRISEFPVQLPPLRDRQGDIEILADHFLKLYGGASFTPAAISVMREYLWPGNIREMRSVIRRACINCPEGKVSAEYLELSSGSVPANGSSLSLKERSAAAARKMEKQLITDALERTEGNRTRAAESLGITYRTLLTKIRELGLAE